MRSADRVKSDGVAGDVHTVRAGGGIRRRSRTARRDGAGLRKPFDTYPGSKDASGVCENIVGIYPPHSLYVETFAGGAACARRKVPALRTILIDRDPRVVSAWRRHTPAGTTVVRACGIAWLERHGHELPADALVYADPPYPRSTRSRKRLYRYEMTDADHRRLLAVLVRLRCSVVVSSYPNPMYDDALRGWNRKTFRAMTRGGVRTEAVWWRSTTGGFADAARYAGRDYRDRERIKRKASRWAAKFRSMPGPERAALFDALQRAHAGDTVGNGGASSPASSDGVLQHRRKRRWPRASSKSTSGPTRQIRRGVSR